LFKILKANSKEIFQVRFFFAGFTKYSTRVGEDNSEGAEILYECVSGYQMDDIGSVRVTLICQEDGKWSKSMPQCRRKLLDPTVQEDLTQDQTIMRLTNHWLCHCD